jgi:four helix bundle protein
MASTMGLEVEYDDWVKGVPIAITADPLWRMGVYRLGLFLADRGWTDVTLLSKDRRTRAIADQLNRALGSISANVAEGYSRGTGKDRARFFEYALGSARESRDWYYKSRHILGEEIINQRLELLAQVIRMLLRIVPTERGDRIREAPVLYDLPSVSLMDSHLDSLDGLSFGDSDASD